MTAKDKESSSLCCGDSSVVPVSSTDALQALWYIADTTGPRLLSFSLDMDEGTMEVGMRFLKNIIIVIFVILLMFLGGVKK